MPNPFRKPPGELPEVAPETVATVVPEVAPAVAPDAAPEAPVELESVMELPPSGFKVATLIREEGPYALGQAVTTDPGAPWEKGKSPLFLGDEEQMKLWRTAGKPLFVDNGRFEAWATDGALDLAAKEVANG